MKSAFEFKPEFKLWFSANHMLYANDGSFGFWRRIRIIPFNQEFDDKVDLNLKDKLLREKEGIFKWCVDGAYHWYRELSSSRGKTGLGPCAAIDEATERYKSENDVFGEFVKKHIEIKPGSKVGAREVYEQYKLWANSNSSDDYIKPISEMVFSKRMQERGFTKERLKQNKLYIDIKLKNVGGGYNF
jgi:putative DNA primase/helicase